MNTGTAVITGASSGLGLQCARALLRRDASWHVVLAVRDPARGRAAMEELGEPNRCSVLEVDLASVRSVRSFVETVRTTPLPPIRALVCNAGLQVVSGIAFTDDGVEMTFGVNHLGHFALVTGILDWLARPAPATIRRSCDWRTVSCRRCCASFPSFTAPGSPANTWRRWRSIRGSRA